MRYYECMATVSDISDTLSDALIFAKSDNIKVIRSMSGFVSDKMAKKQIDKWSKECCIIMAQIIELDDADNSYKNVIAVDV